MRIVRQAFRAGGGFARGRPTTHEQSIHLTPNAESEFALEVKKTGLMAGKKHHLVFTQYEGTVSHEPTLVTFSVKAASLVCQDDWVKQKDREKIARYAVEDLLEASLYPTLRYRSTAVTQDGERYAITGNLLIKNRTWAVPVWVVPQVNHRKTIWTGGATIRLTNFNLKPPTAAFGAIGTEDNMQLLFRLITNG